MAKYSVPMSGWASVTVEVETDATDPEEIFEEAVSQGVPGVCAQCSGWGRRHSLEIGDEWEPVTDEEGATIVYPEED